VSYTVAANTGKKARTGTLTIGGVKFTVTQACPNCVIYQQGANGYTGSGDRNISSLYANQSWNGGIGVTDVAGSQLLELKNDSDYESRALLRFTGISIPAGTQVVSATLTITLVSWLSVSPSITGYYMLEPWNGTSTSALNWKYYTTTNLWNKSGAYGIGTDVAAGKTFVISGITGNGTQVLTGSLDPATVQSWINTPATNQGVLLTIPLQPTTGYMNLYRSGASQNLRPELIIHYE
jgi:hypothetical protein